MTKSNVSDLNLSLLEESSYKSKIDLKCRDFKLFEQFSDLSISEDDRSQIIDELYRRDPLLLNELFNNTMSSFIEHQTSGLKNNIYYLIKNDKIDFPKKIQLIELICQSSNEYITIFQMIINLFSKVCRYDNLQQASDNVSTTLLFYTIKQLFVKDIFKSIDTVIFKQIFDVINSLLHNEHYNEDFKYRLFNSIRLEVNIDQVNKNKLALIFIVYPFQNYKYSLFMCQFLYNQCSSLNISQYELWFLSVERLYNLAKESKDEYCIADVSDFLLGIETNPVLEVYFKRLAEELFETIKWSSGSSRTFFNNRQNIHSINIAESVKPFFDKIMDLDFDNILPHDESSNNQVVDEIIEMCMKIESISFNIDRIQRTIQRFILDSGVYTDKYVSLLQLLFRCYFYIKITKNNDEELCKRFAEELDEMADTCSTGHLVRLANVFSGFDHTLSINVEEELKSCIFQRLTKIINSKSDVETEKIYEDVQSEAFMQILSKDLVGLFKELEKEYVESKIISLNHLQESYRKYLTAFQTGDDV